MLAAGCLVSAGLRRGPQRGTAQRHKTWPRDAALPDFVQLILEHFKPCMQAQPTLKDATLGRLSTPVLTIVGGRDAMLDSHEDEAAAEPDQ